MSVVNVAKKYSVKETNITSKNIYQRKNTIDGKSVIGILPIPSQRFGHNPSNSSGMLFVSFLFIFTMTVTSWSSPYNSFNTLTLWFPSAAL